MMERQKKTKKKNGGVEIIEELKRKRGITRTEKRHISRRIREEKRIRE